MSGEQKSKKSFWDILNTPVQDLFKAEETAAPVATLVAEASPPLAPPEATLAQTVDAPLEQILVETPVEPVAATVPPMVPAAEAEPLVLETPAEPETESDWFATLKDKLSLGLGRDKPRSQEEKTSWFQRLKDRLGKTRHDFVDSLNRLFKGRTKVDADLLDELEEILLQSDVGVDTTDEILAHLKTLAKENRFLPEEVLPSIRQYLEAELLSEPFLIQEGRLNIFLVTGVNGTGKTTTVGKIAAKLKISGYKVMLAAADTFRAAAIDQLAVWGKRVGVPVIHHQEGADAAAVVYDAIQAAHARKMDVLLIDTAGRLHNKDNLMAELKKIGKIVEREKGEAVVEALLVLDATTGQNGMRQAEVFAAAVPLKGIILTKLDGTAKGGVVFSIKRTLNLPIKLMGIGENLEDLQEFDPAMFVEALFTNETEA